MALQLNVTLSWLFVAAVSINDHIYVCLYVRPSVCQYLHRNLYTCMLYCSQVRQVFLIIKYLNVHGKIVIGNIEN